MEQSDLYSLWQDDATSDKQNKDRPAFVLSYAAELNEHVETDDPVPTEGMKDAREWLESYKETVTAQLSPDEPEGS